MIDVEQIEIHSLSLFLNLLLCFSQHNQQLLNKFLTGLKKEKKNRKESCRRRYSQE